MRILIRLKYAILFVASVLIAMLMVTKSTQTPAILAAWGVSSSQASSVPQPHMISNPAAVYCTDMGYEYQVISDGTGGQTDTCSMPDGSVCGAWDFLEGKCGQAYSYCAKQGLGERTASDGKNPFSPEYAVCMDAQGKDVGHVTALFDLAPKLNHCGTTNEKQVASTSTPAAALAAQANSNPPMDLTGPLPASWDWRNATFNNISGDWTTPVKNQAGCGSCWAFAAVGQTEAVLNLAASNPGLDPNLAEEYLVSDCSSAGTCCGGWPASALNFIKNQGIPDEACLPYISGTCGCSGSCSTSCLYRNGGSCANSTCSQRCSDYGSRLKHIDSYGYVSSDQTAIKQALITYGPLSVALFMGGSFNNGIYTCSSNGSTNHAVVIVGYNDTGNYWIAKNSWGSSWNGNGFFKVGYGQCLIENYVYYAHVVPAEMNNHNYLPLMIKP